jgi:hypothetical protein
MFFFGGEIYLGLSHYYYYGSCIGLGLSFRILDHEIISNFLAGQPTTHSLLIHPQQLNKKRPGASGASMAPQVLISNSCGVKSCQCDCGTGATALMALGCKGRAPSMDKDHQNLEMPLLGCETVERQR